MDGVDDDARLAKHLMFDFMLRGLLMWRFRRRSPWGPRSLKVVSPFIVRVLHGLDTDRAHQVLERLPLLDAHPRAVELAFEKALRILELKRQGAGKARGPRGT